MHKDKNQFLPAQIDSSWTLFLDRDGVININKDDDYVVHHREFIFKEGVLEAIADLSQMFGRIIVVTNQRGVEKGLMTLGDLHDIHQFMVEKITLTGGRIDDIFYCTSLEDNHPDRKPNPGMALKAKDKYPEIDFSKAIMVGDKSADMEWGRNIGARTVWITSKRYEDTVRGETIDVTCDSLSDLVHSLRLQK